MAGITVPSVELTGGVKFPMIGFGTWQSAPEVVGNAVRTALDAGYRHIDCAWNYFNEKEVGQAIRDKIAEGKVKREDVFVTTKLWCTFHRPEDVKRGFQESLKDLGLDYIDLFLIHGPPAFKPGPKWLATDDSDFDDTDYVDTFKAMESLVDEGLCRAIGVSNFNPQQLERVLQDCRIKPAVNQVELHPYLVQQQLVDYCKSKGVVITAYSPLGSPGRDFAQPGEARVLEDPVVLDIAKNHGKTPAQVLLRYHLDRGIVIIPKSVTPSRIKENLQVLDFSLTSDDIKKLNSLDRNNRYVDWSFCKTHKYFPFHDSA
ncbi:PREDICTED: aldose reductase-like [Branchiostoma belcheri]|uniref:alcohol dehydrogenase (NADP(+)) n=1 Tax=Branchiostoma belcheri TaxID=7741 RepID=A0A6P4ZJ08_BRABE|nr:PREDICTED: aldose reductase-like [Branchiostoma belcheri]